MTTMRGFTSSYLSLAGFLPYFQLNWAKDAGKFHDVFLRVVLSLLLTLPLQYIILQLIHLVRVKISGNRAVRASLRFIYPFSLFHLYWFQYVSDQMWRYTHTVIVSLFALAMMAALFRSRRHFTPASEHPARIVDALMDINRFFTAGLQNWFAAVRNALTGEVRLRGLVFHPATWVLLMMELVLLIKYSAFSFGFALLFPLSVVSTLLLPIVLLQTVHLLTERIPVLRVIAVTAVFLLYFMLTFYHITEDTPFDFSVFRLNADLLTHSQSYALLFDRLRLQSFIFVIFGIVATILLLIGRSRKNASGTVTRVSVKTTLICCGIYGFLFALPLQNLDPVHGLYRSIANYRQQQATLQQVTATLTEPFPYFHPADTTRISPLSSSSLPNIIFVCLESFNGLLIEKETEQGKPITPFFNSLIPKGIYLEHFYGSSIQTIRGFFTILTGTPPSYRAKIATSYPDLSFIGLPAILSDLGYTTCFFKAFHDLGYDNTGDFMQRAGYRHIRSMTDDILTEQEKSMRWGWGLQDDYFYRKSFTIIDSLHNNTTEKNHPFFITTFNVSHHMMFDDIPPEQKHLYPDAGPDDYRKNFRNSTFLADSCLRELFTQIEKRDWLRNSIIVIVGDHGFPNGMHATKNEKGAWEENFRTPFLLLWKDHLEPRRFSQKAYSQVDIAPTLFDLLDIRPAHHAIGTSLFSNEPRPPVVCTQPYDGIYLTSIDYPYKYVRKCSGITRSLFDLAADPLERDNRINDPALLPVIRKLEKATASLMVNQVLVDRNRLCPSGNYFCGK